MLEKAREFRASFSPEMLKFDRRLFITYQAAGPGSRAFNVRLIELVAIVGHQFAVIVFKLDTSLHKEDGIAAWTPPESDIVYWAIFPEGLPPFFSHSWYIDHEQYPDGPADVAAYWAEAHILGGVILFDRNARDGADPDAVYIHPNRRSSTYRICKLLQTQKRALLDFLVSPELPPQQFKPPLPILTSRDNMPRVDPEEPIDETGVYRDLYERKTRSPLERSDWRKRDIWDRKNFPTMDDRNAAYRRALELQERYRKRWREMEEP